jgi:hypothetical protein
MKEELRTEQVVEVQVVGWMRDWELNEGVSRSWFDLIDGRRDGVNQDQVGRASIEACDGTVIST